VDAADGLETVGEAGSAERAIELAREIEPDLVLMDVWMSGTDGITAARAIKARRPETVVVLTSTTHPDDLPLTGRTASRTR
jgi:DNA-binding NarL/FixJ family response regulator